MSFLKGLGDIFTPVLKEAELEIERQLQDSTRQAVQAATAEVNRNIAQGFQGFFHEVGLPGPAIPAGPAPSGPVVIPPTVIRQAATVVAAEDSGYSFP